MQRSYCLVTGASSGIGYATALGLARAGNIVAVLCRGGWQAEATVRRLEKDSGNQLLHPFQADLSSQKQIRKAASRLRGALPRLDVLVHNAGVCYSRLKWTEDGIETVFAVNHLAPFLVTHELWPLLQQSRHACVIVVSSESHRFAKLHFDDLYLTRNYHILRAYAQSKLANILFTGEFAKRCPDPRVKTFSVSPGLVKTRIGNKNTHWLHSFLWRCRLVLGPSRTPAEGARTSLFLAASPEVRRPSGLYWEDCLPASPGRRSLSPKDSATLWEISLELCGVRNYFPD